MSVSFVGKGNWEVVYNFLIIGFYGSKTTFSVTPEIILRSLKQILENVYWIIWSNSQVPTFNHLHHSTTCILEWASDTQQISLFFHGCSLTIGPRRVHLIVDDITIRRSLIPIQCNRVWFWWHSELQLLSKVKTIISNTVPELFMSPLSYTCCCYGC